MNYLVIDTAYWKSFVHSEKSESGHASVRPVSVGSSYATALSRLRGVSSDFFCANALPQRPGGETRINNELLVKIQYRFWQLISRLPIFGIRLYSRGPLARNLVQKIRASRPDVLLVCNTNLINPVLVKELSDLGIEWFAIHSSPPPPRAWLNHYTHIFSALPSLVEKFGGLGLSASYMPLAISIEKANRPVKLFTERTKDVSFVGTLNRHFIGSVFLFRQISKVGALQIYSQSSPLKFLVAGLKREYKGECHDPSEVYSDSRVVINRHIRMARGYSSNLRMFEAAAAGAVLVTESSENLCSLFEVGVEVVAYSSSRDAVQHIRSLLGDNAQAEKLGEAGRQRLLRSHLYEHRASELHREIELALSR